VNHRRRRHEDDPLSEPSPTPSEPLEAADLVLLLLQADAPGQEAGRLHGITRLEKLLFLATQEERADLEVENPFPFIAYDYGPYSKEIYEAVEVLEKADLLEETRVSSTASLDEMEEVAAVDADTEGVERRFRLTRQGLAVAEYLAHQHPEAAGKVQRVKERYGTLPLRRLIQYVYSNYPDYAKASVIRDEVLGY